MSPNTRTPILGMSHPGCVVIQENDKESRPMTPRCVISKACESRIKLSHMVPRGPEPPRCIFTPITLQPPQVRAPVSPYSYPHATHRRAWPQSRYHGTWHTSTIGSFKVATYWPLIDRLI